MEAARNAVDKVRLRLSLLKCAEIWLGLRLFLMRILNKETNPSLKLEKNERCQIHIKARARVHNSRKTGENSQICKTYGYNI